MKRGLPSLLNLVEIMPFKDPERKKEYNRQWGRNHPKDKKKQKEYDKLRYAINAEYFKENNRKWRANHPKYTSYLNHKNGICLPMSKNENCSSYLGIHIAEQALSMFFDTIIRMPTNHIGYDFLCGKGFKIDVKSACRYAHPQRKTDCWYFNINRNKITNYFLCLGFDNRKSLNPEHVWLIPSHIVNNKRAFQISESKLPKWSQYEKPLDKVIACCNQMKEGEKSCLKR